VSVYRSATEIAYEYLRERILTGELVGGDRVNLDVVASKVGVSRTPVRDAVRQLSNEGLLTVYPRRGVIVTSLSVDDVMELFETRAVLEGLAVTSGMAAMDAAARASLADMVARLESWRGSPQQYLRLHDAFHHALCGHARRPRLLAHIRALREAVGPYIRLFLKLHGGEMDGTLHRPILDAIEGGDRDVAERAVRHHVVAGGTGLVAFLRSSGVVHQR
jgi:DNA-binding GntR family transcriptional regulator